MTVRVCDMYPPGRVCIRETGLRDGLQLVRFYPSTDQKRQWVHLDYQAGVRHFEAGSYLPPATAPQFADVDAVVDAVVAGPGAWASTLVLNLKGAERALDGHTHEINCVLSASEAHNLANARRTQDQSVKEIGEIMQRRDASRSRPVIAVGIAMAFGCSIAGRDAVAPGDVAALAERVVEQGADLVGLADTVGYAGPAQVRAVIRAVRAAIGSTPISLHFHDTRGLGLANAAAALDEGVTLLDASLGGLGGCPFAPGATGNVVLEDLAFLCRTMGHVTGIDPDRLLLARELLTSVLPDEPLHGSYALARAPLGF